MASLYGRGPHSQSCAFHRSAKLRADLPLNLDVDLRLNHTRCNFVSYPACFIRKGIFLDYVVKLNKILRDGLLWIWTIKGWSAKLWWSVNFTLKDFSKFLAAMRSALQLMKNIQYFGEQVPWESTAVQSTARRLLNSALGSIIPWAGLWWSLSSLGHQNVRVSLGLLRGTNWPYGFADGKNRLWLVVPTLEFVFNIIPFLLTLQFYAGTNAERS